MRVPARYSNGIMSNGTATITVRRAAAADAAQIATIYNEGIDGRAATFETAPRSAADIAEWFAAGLSTTMVAEVDGWVTGWARLAPYSSRPCYAGIGEASIYGGEEHRGRGIGTALGRVLAAEAERTGFHKLLGKLFPENEASSRLVARLGFRLAGLHVRHARLDGRWRDVLLVELLLGEADASR
jgi:phosphinothricin acetyltransferase